jgi:hypothetical protein
MIAGSLMFFGSAAAAVPRVYTEPDSAVRVRMLEDHLLLWRLGQPPFAFGALIAGLGVGALAAASKRSSQTMLALSCGLLVVGALSWSWCVFLRGVRPREFALGELPSWPFGIYLWLTLGGLLLLGVGIVLDDWPSWLGWLIITADALFLAVYIRFRDLPPFVFYVVLTVVGIAVL